MAIVTIDEAVRTGYTTVRHLQDPSRLNCRGRINGRFWGLVNDMSSLLGHEGFQKGKPWRELVGWRGVANSENVDSMFVEDSFELGEEIGGRRWWDRVEIDNISVFGGFSSAQPAFGNDIWRSISRGHGAIAVRDHTFAFLEGKVMVDKAE